MCNLSSQTAIVPEKCGASLLQMMTLEMMLGNTEIQTRVLHHWVRKQVCNKITENTDNHSLLKKIWCGLC